MTPLISSHRKVSQPKTALSMLNERTRSLNETYLRAVNARDMLRPEEAAHWNGQIVDVFLRHDKLMVFAIVCGDRVCMADYVYLNNVTFHVDEVGRGQSNADAGPLPNGKTVHAWLTGQLEWPTNRTWIPDGESWEAVTYHPELGATFRREQRQTAIHQSETARLIPGARKVWCPGKTEDSSGDQL